MESSAHRSLVHLYYEDVAAKVAEYVARGVHVFIMHMDDERMIMDKLSTVGAKPAPLGEAVGDSTLILNNILQISDSLYKDMCMNGSDDHTLLFSYLTELAKTIVDADRASFWKWDKASHTLWTTAATGTSSPAVGS